MTDKIFYNYYEELLNKIVLPQTYQCKQCEKCKKCKHIKE